MKSYEKKKEFFRTCARKGHFGIGRLTILPSEFRKFTKENLLLTILDKKNGGRDKIFVCKIDWNYAYGETIPFAVSNYISGKTEVFPTSEIQTLAQELYVIAYRAHNMLVLKNRH